MQRRRITRVGVALVAIGVALLLAELVIRMTGLAPELRNQYGAFVADPVLPFRPRPGSTRTGTSDSGEFDYDHRHNSLGFRDREHSAVKEDGVFRILGLGDSFTYGIGAAFEDTYLARLEEMLNGRGPAHPRIEIVKAGIPRYFTEPERILLERHGPELEPDLVLVGFLPNDVIDTHLGLESVSVAKSGFLRTREALALGKAGSWLYEHSHLGRLVLRGYVNMRIRARYSPDMEQVYRLGGSHEADWERVETELAAIVRMAESAGAAAVVVNIPQQPPWTGAHSYPGRRLATWCARNGAGFIDTLPAMRRAPDPGALYWPRDGHCRSGGYEIIAAALYEGLTRNGWVP